VGGFDQALDGYEDWDFWLKLGETGFRGRLIPELLFNYRRHGTTLNLRSDRRYHKLVDHIKANHRELYSHPEQIREIQKNYHDIRVPGPFLNLSSQNQYENAEKSQVVVVLEHCTQIIDLFLQNIRSALRSQNAFNFILVATDRVSYNDENYAAVPNLPGQIYNVTQFLDSYCWLDFVLNVIETRSVRLVVVSNSEVAYEWTNVIKARTSALVVNVIQDSGAEYLRLSAKYDRFIDLHIVSSEQDMKSLMSKFGISSTKIHLLTKSPSSKEAADLLNVLMVHAKREQST
jgi:hypothetical protein